MPSKTWAVYKPSKDGKKESAALKLLRQTTYNAAMLLNAVCLKRRIDLLQARLKQREDELWGYQAAFEACHQLALEGDFEITTARFNEMVQAELRVREIEAQLEATLGAAIDRGLIELED